MRHPHRNSDLTGTMLRGSLWLFSASTLLAASSFAANWALGCWLSRGDFGVYALAISYATLLQVFRDGGVQYWLARQNDTQYRACQEAAFGLTMIASAVVGLVLVILGLILGYAYANEDVRNLVILLGCATPLQSLSIVTDAGLQVRMRFRELSLIRALVGCVRYGLTVLLAYHGWGPYSFVYPLFVVAVLQMACSCALTHTPIWHFRPGWNQIRDVLRFSKWAMTGTFATALLQQVDYVTLGAITPKTVTGLANVGTYFFAFLLAMQPSTVLGQSVRKVFVPAFAAAGSSPARRYRGAWNAASVLGLLVSPLVLWFALSAPEFVRLLWQHKWDPAIPAIQLLAIVVPIHLLVDVSRMITQADGRFRLWTSGVFLRGVSIMLAVLIAGALGGVQDVTIVAASVALFIAVGGLAESTVLLRNASLPAKLVFGDFCRPYAASCLAALTSWMLYREHPPSAERLGLLTVTFGTVYTACALLFFRQSLIQLLDLARRLTQRGGQPANESPALPDQGSETDPAYTASVGPLRPAAGLRVSEGAP